MGSCLLPLLMKPRGANSSLTLLHSERPKLYTILAFLSAISLRVYHFGLSECNRVKVCNFVLSECNRVKSIQFCPS